jgi:hypothetical protein
VNPFAPLPEAEFDAYKAAHLLWRAGFGGTSQEAETLAAGGLKEAIQKLVHLSPSGEAERPRCAALPEEDERSFHRRIRDLPEPERGQAAAERRKAERQKITDLRFWWLNRMLTTQRPLEEKLSLFWHSHFASSFEEKIEHAYPMWQQNEMFRRHAFAPFPDLMRQVIRDPAMLVWLDNAQSHRGRPNENFARELMELFSTGVGAYTEEDVKEAARALTGWSVNRESWTFVKREEAHDDGAKTFLGQNGDWDGDDVVRIICEQPATGRFMARKFIEFFVLPNPEPELVEAAAKIYRANGYNHRLFLHTLFSSQLFYSARSMNGIVKSPVVLTIGALKSMRVPVPEKGVLVDALRLMGQDLFFPPDVNGWPGGMAWINSNMLLVRYNFANYLLNGVSPDQFRVFDKRAAGSALKRRQFVEGERAQVVDWSPRRQLRESGADRRLVTAGDIVDYYLREFLQRPIPKELRLQLLNFAETDAAGGRRSFSLNDANFDERVRGLVHLIMSSPDYQLC